MIFVRCCPASAQILARCLNQRAGRFLLGVDSDDPPLSFNRQGTMTNQHGREGSDQSRCCTGRRALPPGLHGFRGLSLSHINASTPHDARGITSLSPPHLQRSSPALKLPFSSRTSNGVTQKTDFYSRILRRSKPRFGSWFLRKLDSYYLWPEHFLQQYHHRNPNPRGCLFRHLLRYVHPHPWIRVQGTDMISRPKQGLKPGYLVEF